MFSNEEIFIRFAYENLSKSLLRFDFSLNIVYTLEHLSITKYHKINCFRFSL